MLDSKPPAKVAMLIVLSLLLLCYGLEKVHCSTVHENSEDFHSLMDFKKGITNDPSGALNNWSNDTHFCRWNGVNCTLTRPYRVMELKLRAYNLAGQISSSLGNLTYLNSLILSNNRFHGSIPPLNNLQYLVSLSAKQPLARCYSRHTYILFQPTYLDLSGNNLTGVIPLRIGFLTKLLGLSLFRNSLTGGIPPGLGNMTNLWALDVSENQLNGPIPSGVWKLPNLESLRLSQNNLSGGIPQNLNNLTYLTELSLTSNRLSNTLPSNFGNALPNIQYLYLGGNMFEGHIPASLGNTSRLVHLGLSQNKLLTGQIPSIFRKLSGLSVLNLEENMLEANDSTGWEFFDALKNCTSLKTLSLATNHLQGVIPNSIANLSTNLTYLIMGGNSLSGTVPSTIGKFSSLIQLSLDNNNFTGMIGEWIGKLTSLQRLNLGGNYLAGTIQPSIGNLTQLSYMDFAENKFTGFVPTSLGNIQQLSNLHLSYNNFQGSIPVQFGNLKQLISLDVSSNKLSGEIPETLGSCQQLVMIQMDQNILTGNIPTTFSNLFSLRVLNLSHNVLSGPMPDFLNNLELLTTLDLSYNNFKGEIPRNNLFINVTIVSLNGNPGLFGGASDFHLHPCQVVSRRVGIINSLFKTLIPIFGFMSLIMLAFVMFHWKKKTSRRPYLLLFSFGKQFPKVSYNDLVQATGNFCESNLIGRGSYGSVYKGKITLAKMQVAIKVFDLGVRCADRSFISECEVLRRIRHRNLLPILTACSTTDNSGNDFKALIYVFMQNGNLHTWLHHRPSIVASKRLGLIERINIAVNIADALAYLHHDCGRPIVHCDLKPTNILLDDDMNAHLGDFGIASLVLDSRSIEGGHSGLNSSVLGHSGLNSSVVVTGTIGYIAPEYGQSVHASTRGDVYSFGIVLLEMVIGKRPTDPMFENELNIVSFVESNFPDKILGKIDAHLQEERKCTIQTVPEAEQEINRCLLSVVQVSLSCTRLSPRERMNMREVAINLHAIRRAYIAAIKRQ